MCPEGRAANKPRDERARVSAKTIGTRNMPQIARGTAASRCRECVTYSFRLSGLTALACPFWHGRAPFGRITSIVTSIRKVWTSTRRHTRRGVPAHSKTRPRHPRVCMLYCEQRAVTPAQGHYRSGEMFQSSDNAVTPPHLCRGEGVFFDGASRDLFLREIRTRESFQIGRRS